MSVKSEPQRLTLILLLLLGFFANAWFLNGPPHSMRSFRPARSLLRAVGKSKTQSRDEDIDLGSVTDAEALLACRAYLVRKGRFEWKGSKERSHQRRMAAMEQPEGGSFLLPGETATRHNNLDGIDVWNLMDPNASDIEEEGDENEEDEIWETAISMKSENQRYHLLPLADDVEEAEELVWEASEVFSEPDGAVSASHFRRSRAAKLMWSDPVWKEAWYASRWAGKVKKKKNHRRLEQRLRSVDVESLLAHDEMASLEEEEIVGAIRTYLNANWKRSESRKQAMIDQRTAVSIQDPKERLDRDVLFKQNHEVLAEAQRKRSERAAKAYKRRLENQVKTRAGLKKRRVKPPSVAAKHRNDAVVQTPDNALKLIEAALDEGSCPSISHVKLVVKPAKLAKRKDLLLRILKEQFGLRGKCVPTYIYRDNSDIPATVTTPMQFATKCSVRDLGTLVLSKLAQPKEPSD